MFSKKSILVILLSLFLFSTGISFAEDLKPRIVVLTDIAPNDVEPDDMESMIRLLSHADLFEIEALVATTGWSNNGGKERIDLIYKALDAYEKDLSNLKKRSDQQTFFKDQSTQQIGYWPSVDYLRSRTVLGSTKMGYRFIGPDNDSAGSNLIIKLADEPDTRPLWVGVWGGGNTLAQAIWRVKNDRTDQQLKDFLHKIRVYTITDQDKPWGANVAFDISSHQWMRREFKKDLMFIWDECAWNFQNETGKRNWDKYAANIQDHGNLGTLYPKYKWGVEGDTPSYLYVMPVGLSNPNIPTQGGWGGLFAWGTGPDDVTDCYINQKGTETFNISTKYQEHFYPAVFNNFAARMDWAKDGTGNRNPIVVVDGQTGLAIINIKSTQGTQFTLDASLSSDPDGDNLKFSWWLLPEAGTYKQDITMSSQNESKLIVNIPSDSAGKTFHIICEVTDDGSPELTSYRRIIFEPTAIASDNEP